MRRAGPQDREAFCRQVLAKVYPDSPIIGLTGQRRQALFLQNYRENWERALATSALFFSDDGFLVGIPGNVDTLTRHHQTVIWDWGGDVGPLLAALEANGQAAGDKYLVVRLFAGEDQTFPGFAPELTRVLKKVIPAPSDGPFQLRRAEPRDVMFIANQNLQGAQFYLPANRGLDPQEFAAASMTQYLSLDLSPDSTMLGLLICEGKRPFGYILVQLNLNLDLTGEPAAYLYDLNLKPEFWGRGAGRILGNYTQTVLAERGCQYLVGDISCSNQRALQVAVHSIGFATEWVRWGRPIPKR